MQYPVSFHESRHIFFSNSVVMKRVLLAVGLFSMILLGMAPFSPLFAASDKMPQWKKVGSWDVRVDRTLGNGCFAAAAYRGGSVFRIGIDATDKKWAGYMLFGNDDWASLEEGKEYSLTYVFDSSEPWFGDAVAFKFNKYDDVTYLVQRFDKPDLFKDYMRKNSVKIKYKGKQIEQLSLKGSYAAFMEVLRCQDTMNRGGARSNRVKDPFAASSTRKRDPFAQ